MNPWPVNPWPVNPWHIARAVRALKAGGVVLHATEGVWGFACDPYDLDAVMRILTLKGRSVDKGLIVVGHDAQTFEPEIAALTDEEQAMVLGTWPGPATWVLPNRQFPEWITGGRDSVAVRVPGHAQTRALAEAFGGPLVSTSANPSGRAAAVTELGVRCRFSARRFPGRQDYVLPGRVCQPGVPSEIRTLHGSVLRSRRPIAEGGA